ncbi:MAG TPA: hypothetical protein VN963_08175, partial [bacterium]|nr:hypothetical protein [bacterium]
SRLKGRVSDPFGAVNAALDVILPQKLATGKITALVKWIKAGKPVGEFDPKQKPINHQDTKGTKNSETTLV